MAFTIPTLLPKVPSSSADRAYLDDLISDNLVARTFEQNGYQFIAITSGFPAIVFPKAQMEMHSVGGLSLLETSLINSTPIHESANVGRSMYRIRRDWLDSAVDSLTGLAGTTSQPRFIFAHILAPHPPFVFGPHGETNSHGKAFGYWDGDDFIKNGQSREDYRAGYAGQVEYMSRRIVKAVETLNSSRGVKPIIIIQGDHGSKLNLAQNSLEQTDINECFPILNAYSVPKSIQEKLYPGITPVNSFRIIFNELFGQELPLLPDQSWYSRFAKPYDFTNVTDRITLKPNPSSEKVPAASLTAVPVGK